MESEPLEETLHCMGYYGFGGGYLLGQRGPAEAFEGQELYCGRCPKSQACWDAHRARVKSAVPEACQAFEDLVAEVGSQKAVAQMLAEFQQADPYSTVMMGNLQDGSRVANKMAPMDRERFTIPWPLRPT